MTSEELLRHQSVQLPLVRPKVSGGEILSFFNDKFEAYNALIKQLDSGSSDHLRPVAEQLSGAILKAVYHTYRGHPHLAYESIATVLNGIKSAILHMLRTVDGATIGEFYRIRRGAAEQWDREDMFHIPFEKHHLVQTQRYSIPGLPCLYLGGSLYISWEELGRRPFSELQVSQFWAADDSKLRIFDLGIWPKYVLHLASLAKPSLSEDTLGAAIALWPLIAACSVRVAQPGAPFIDEYIIPQLLLQWLTQHDDFDGIRYFSCRRNSLDTGVNAVSNFVFPARKILPAGHCTQLKKLFRLTRPLPWQVLSAMSFETHFERPSPVTDIEIIDGMKTYYPDTEWGKIERKLHQLMLHDKKEHLGALP